MFHKIKWRIHKSIKKGPPKQRLVQYTSVPSGLVTISWYPDDEYGVVTASMNGERLLWSYIKTITEGKQHAQALLEKIYKTYKKQIQQVEQVLNVTSKKTSKGK